MSHTKRGEPTRAASQLLQTVRNRPVVFYHSFLRALDETGHEHVRELIEAGNYQGTYACMEHCSRRKPYSLDCHGGAMGMYHCSIQNLVDFSSARN